MSGFFSFIPGQLPVHPGPLSRYLPPIPEGPAAAWLLENVKPGSWILDPFGASPRLAAEAARAGYRVLVAANNPIERFLFELTCSPPGESELRAALADLGATQKAGERLEPHLLSLYRSECAKCKSPVSVEAFIWDRQSNAPASRIYHCKQCDETQEQPPTSADLQRAAQFGSGGVHRIRALERVTPLDDPDRPLAEEALDTYLPRALYALITLINKIESLPANRKHLIAALLLPVLDQANTLWSYPSSRARPRQLTIPNRFREQNIWLALEAAIKYWADSTRDIPPIPLTIWPEQPPESGGISLFHGPLRELAEKIPHGDALEHLISAAIGAIPRPNQAYWTLSALWAGWLWGHDATAHFKSVLRRRRYDWSWHSTALHAACKSLAQILPQEAHFLGFIGEAEPGYLAAALIAAETAGLNLGGAAIRFEQGQAQILWQRTALSHTAINRDQARLSAQQAARNCLLARREPADFAVLHFAVLSGMIQTQMLSTSPLLTPADVLGETQEVIQAILADRGTFIKTGADKSPESGQWWLRNPEEDSNAPAETALALSDQVEISVIRYLINHPGFSLAEVDRMLCADFPGLLTPEQELVRVCLESYGTPIQQPESDRWQLRSQDDPKARRADLERIHNLLFTLGDRLGYRVSEQELPVEKSAIIGQPVRKPIYWSKSLEKPDYEFYILASALIGTIVIPNGKVDFPSQVDRKTGQEQLFSQHTRRIIVVPGGRASLISFKVSHNLFLKQAIEAGWQIIKFRHVRRLSESDYLTPENLDSQLALDPLANKDPQMALL